MWRGWQSLQAGVPCPGKLALPRGRAVGVAVSAGVAISAGTEKSLELPDLGPDTFAEAFPERAGDNLQFPDEQTFTTDISDALAWLDTMDSMDTVPDVPSAPHNPYLSAFLNQPPDLCEHGAEGDHFEGRAVGAMLGDADPFSGVAMSPWPDPEQEQGRGAAVLPTGLPEGPVESPAERSLVRGRPEGPPESALEGPRQSALPSPAAAPRRHRPRTADPQNHRITE